MNLCKICIRNVNKRFIQCKDIRLWEKLLDVNLTASFLTCKTFIGTFSYLFHFFLSTCHYLIILHILILKCSCFLSYIYCEMYKPFLTCLSFSPQYFYIQIFSFHPFSLSVIILTYFSLFGYFMCFPLFSIMFIINFTITTSTSP